MSRTSDGEKMPCSLCKNPTYALYMLIPKEEGRHEKKVLSDRRYCQTCDVIYSTRLTMKVES